MVSHTFIVRPPVEGVQEFKVITHNVGADYGRAGGAVVVVTSKSGTNQLRASLFEYLRNEKLDARNFFALAGGSKPPYKLNQFGASLGGPVVLPHYNGKSKTFFFTDYEGYREVFGSPLVVTVPTAAARAGNFQGVLVATSASNYLSNLQSATGIGICGWCAGGYRGRPGTRWPPNRPF